MIIIKIYILLLLLSYSEQNRWKFLIMLHTHICKLMFPKANIRHMHTSYGRYEYKLLLRPHTLQKKCQFNEYICVWINSGLL